MNLPTNTEFAAALEKAPQYVKDYTASKELDAAFETIRTKYALHLDDAGTLSDLIVAVVLELIPLAQFDAVVGEYIPSLKDARPNLVRDVNETVFAPLRARAKTTPVEALKASPPAPTPIPKPAPNPVMATKLTTSVHEAPQHVAVTMPPTPPPATPKPSSAPHPYSAGDPYREPPL